jgi:uncharacterized metal-binding protein
MPGARTHDLITVATAAVGLGAYWQLTPRPDWTHAAICAGTYLFAGFACAGDLDLNSAQYRRWGPFRFIWWPYQKLVPHRSWVSHGLILGGVIRILYLIGIFALIAAVVVWGCSVLFGQEEAQHVARRQWASISGVVQEYPTHTALALTGFILAGAVHTLSDCISTTLKRLSL